MKHSLSWASVAFLVAGNLLPVLGVLLWDWSSFLVLFVYWVEAAILGGFTLLQIVLALPGYRPRPGRFVTYRQSAGEASRSFTVAEMSRVWIVPAFVLGYSAGLVLFAVVVAFFLYPRQDLVTILEELEQHRTAWLAAVALLFVDHAAEFSRDFLGGPEWMRSDPVFQMWRPAGFFVMLYLLWLVGAFVSSWFAAPGVLVVFVFFKTIGELCKIPFASAEPWQRDAGAT